MLQGMLEIAEYNEQNIGNALNKKTTEFHIRE